MAIPGGEPTHALPLVEHREPAELLEPTEGARVKGHCPHQTALKSDSAAPLTGGGARPGAEVTAGRRGAAAGRGPHSEDYSPGAGRASLKQQAGSCRGQRGAIVSVLCCCASESFKPELGS